MNDAESQLQEVSFYFEVFNFFVIFTNYSKISLTLSWLMSGKFNELYLVGKCLSLFLSCLTFLLGHLEIRLDMCRTKILMGISRSNVYLILFFPGIAREIAPLWGWICGLYRQFLCQPISLVALRFANVRATSIGPMTFGALRKIADFLTLYYTLINILRNCVHFSAHVNKSNKMLKNLI